MIEINLYGVSAVVLTGILAETAKRAGIPIKFIPLASILFAIAVVCFGTWSLTVEGIITGIVIGATVSGLYDNLKKGIAIVRKE